MEKTNETLVIIDPKHIHPHPNNPRKDVGDISELIESVKKNGIMQNLTVIPLEDQPGEYMALIGHRRHAAAVEAGLSGIPCRIITDLSEKEQVGIMLEENMQRNDLTPYEQGQGFQMMLDFGDTAEEIAERTGFSKATIYHRLNIAKLNQKELQKKEKDPVFQLSITDLYELEKIKSIKTRNEVLKNATDSRTLAQRARNAARDEKREENSKKVIKMLESMGIKPAPNGVNHYSSGWNRAKDINLDGEVPETIRLKGSGPFFYNTGYGYIYILRKENPKKKVKSAYEIEREERAKKNKQIKEILKNVNKRCRELILDVISGKLAPVKEEAELKDSMWTFLLDISAVLYRSTIKVFYTEKNYYNLTMEEKAESDKWAESLSVLHEMLIATYCKLKEMDNIVDWNGYYLKSTAESIKAGYAVFERYGWYFEEEEQQLLDGTHELYKKQEEKTADEQGEMAE